MHSVYSRNWKSRAIYANTVHWRCSVPIRILYTVLCTLYPYNWHRFAYSERRVGAPQCSKRSHCEEWPRGSLAALRTRLSATSSAHIHVLELHTCLFDVLQFSLCRAFALVAGGVEEEPLTRIQFARQLLAATPELRVRLEKLELFSRVVCGTSIGCD